MFKKNHWNFWILFTTQMGWPEPCRFAQDANKERSSRQSCHRLANDTPLIWGHKLPFTPHGHVRKCLLLIRRHDGRITINLITTSGKTNGNTYTARYLVSCGDFCTEKSFPVHKTFLSFTVVRLQKVSSLITQLI